MKRKRLENICKEILGHWKNEGKLEEEQAYIFFDGILDVIMDGEKIPLSDYRQISAGIEKRWQYRSFEELSPQEAFLYGSLWGGIKIEEIYEERIEQQESLEKLVSVYASKEWLFKAIYYNPGIRHKDLAKKGNQSPSQLSQLMASVEKEGLITYNRAGREKYYFLQKRGDQLYKLMKKKDSSELFNRTSEKALVFSKDNLDTHRPELGIWTESHYHSRSLVNRFLNNENTTSSIESATVKGGFRIPCIGQSIQEQSFTSSF